MKYKFSQLEPHIQEHFYNENLEENMVKYPNYPKDEAKEYVLRHLEDEYVFELKDGKITMYFEVDVYEL